MGSSDKFGIFFHHGGTFESLEDIECYVGGHFVGRYDFDVDRFGYLDLEDEIKKLGYISWSKLCYHFPSSNSYRVIKTDKEVMDMLSFLSESRRVFRVYVDGGKKIEGDSQHASDDGKEPENGTYPASDKGKKVEEGIDPDVDHFVSDQGEDSWGENDDSGDDSDDESDDESEENNCLGYDMFSSSEDDFDFNPEDENEVSDDSLGDLDLTDDEEYTQAKKNVRDKKMDDVFRVLDNYHPIDDNLAENNLSEYEDSDGDVHSSETDEELECPRSCRRKRIVYDPRCDHENLKVVLGMRFQDGLECKKALTNLAIENGKFIQFRRVSQRQLEAKCGSHCPWRVYGSTVKADQTFVIKAIGGEHICPRAMDNKLISSKWIANRYLNVFRLRQDVPVKELKGNIIERYATYVKKDKLYKARTIALELLRGTVEDHYALLRGYVAELRRTDRDGRYELLLGDGSVFKGLYMGFSSLKKGFKISCRPIIGLDGCFLKTFLGGMLLCAVGKDGNNQMFPIAWAVVAIENEVCWTWFLKSLIEDLDIRNGEGWTFISDQQKGLENAVSALAPCAEHRNCARHVYMNWKKQHKGSTLKNIFWRAVRSTYVEEYKIALQKMKTESLAAFQDFIARDTSKFCKSFISTSARSDMIDNNISETFNGYILNARGKHVIHMCEEIRCSLMTRQVSKVNQMASVQKRLCPNISKKIEKLKFESRECTSYPALGEKFEVHKEDDKFVVDVRGQSCTCRVWELTGIPCVHAVSAIQFMCKDVDDFVDDYYTVKRCLDGYRCGLEPLRGEKMWPEVEGEKIIPPEIRNMPGRPRKKRKRDEEEIDNKKLKRFGLCMTCGNCGQQGHNRRGCKVEAVSKAPTEKKKRGRPCKLKPQTTETTPSSISMARRRPLARKGSLVLNVPGSGTIYTRMPSQRNVNRRGSRATSSKIQQAGKTRVQATQESTNAEGN